MFVCVRVVASFKTLRKICSLISLSPSVMLCDVMCVCVCVDDRTFRGAERVKSVC